MKNIFQSELGEAALRSIFNVISEAVMLIDLEGKVLAANETSAARLGRKVQDLIGMYLMHALPPDIYQSREKQVDEVVRTQRPVSFQDRRGNRDYANALYPVFDENGEMVQIAIFSQDITKRLQAEAEQARLTHELEQRVEEKTRALRASEARYRAVTELTSDYIFQASILPGLESHIDWSTDSIQRITGYTMDEINQLGMNNIVHPEDLPVIETERARLTAGFSFTGSLRIITRHGIERWLQIYSQPVWNDEQSAVTSFMGAVVDITARVHAEMKLGKRLEIERVLAEIARDFIYSSDIDNSILNTLSKTCQITGTGRSRLYLTGSDGNFVECIYTGSTCKGTPEAGSTLPVSIPLAEKWRLHLSQGNPIYIPDTAQFDEHDPEILSLMQRLDVRSLLLMPVRSESDLLGCLSLEQSSSVAGWDEEIINLLEVESQIIGSALNRVRLLETLEQRIHSRTRHLTALYDITMVASQQLDVHSMLEHTIDRLLEAMDSRVGCIHLLDQDAKKMVMAANRWIPPAVGELIHAVPLDDPLLGHVVQDNYPVVVIDIKNDARTTQYKELQGVQSFVGAPIRSKNQAMGVISIFPPNFSVFSQEDIALLAAIADQIGIAVENIRLRKQAEQSAVLEERQRLGRELHDSVTQSLYSLSLFSQAGINYVQGKDFERSLHYLNRIAETAQEALKEMRLLIYELRPAILEREGLAGALKHRLGMVERRVGVETQLLIHEPLDLPTYVEEGLYHIAQEALNNALKHSGATVTGVTITATDRVVKLKVSDNGCGFDIDAHDFQPGFGITGMQERAAMLGGTIKITSSPQGTTVETVWNRNLQGR